MNIGYARIVGNQPSIRMNMRTARDAEQRIQIWKKQKNIRKKYHSNAKLWGETLSEKKEFVIRVRMEERWIPHFISMLKYMECCGKMGRTRKVSFVSDGDGDFRPEFDFNEDIQEVLPKKDEDGNRIYDAG